MSLCVQRESRTLAMQGPRTPRRSEGNLPPRLYSLKNVFGFLSPIRLPKVTALSCRKERHDWSLFLLSFSQFLFCYSRSENQLLTDISASHFIITVIIIKKVVKTQVRTAVTPQTWVLPFFLSYHHFIDLLSTPREDQDDSKKGSKNFIVTTLKFQLLPFYLSYYHFTAYS